MLCVQVDSITIPVGPRLGDKVVEVSGLSKGFGDRLLVEGVSFSVPPGKAIRAGGTHCSCLSALLQHKRLTDWGNTRGCRAVVPCRANCILCSKDCAPVADMTHQVVQVAQPSTTRSKQTPWRTWVCCSSSPCVLQMRQGGYS